MLLEPINRLAESWNLSIRRWMVSVEGIVASKHHQTFDEIVSEWWYAIRSLVRKIGWWNIRMIEWFSYVSSFEHKNYILPLSCHHSSVFDTDVTHCSRCKEAFNYVDRLSSCFFEACFCGRLSAFRYVQINSARNGIIKPELGVTMCSWVMMQIHVWNFSCLICLETSRVR